MRSWVLDGAVVKRVGSYIITDNLRPGGLGEVCVGYKEQLPNRRVAIKLIRRDHREGKEYDDYVRRLRREAELFSRAENHPNVVQLLDADEDPALGPFIVMEYIKGENVRDQISRLRGNVELVIDLCRQVAMGLRHIHHNGLIHRDLSPENLMVFQDKDAAPHAWRIKIADFGSAFAANDPMLRSERMFGKPHYMPHDPQVTAAWDVYSLGVICREIIGPPEAAPPSNRVRAFFELVDAMTQTRAELRLPTAVSVLTKLEQLPAPLAEMDDEHAQQPTIPIMQIEPQPLTDPRIRRQSTPRPERRLFFWLAVSVLLLVSAGSVGYRLLAAPSTTCTADLKRVEALRKRAYGALDAIAMRDLVQHLADRRCWREAKAETAALRKRLSSASMAEQRRDELLRWVDGAERTLGSR